MDPSRLFAERPSRLWGSFVAQPGLQEPQRVVPKRIDLDRFTAPRRYHPITNLRVHPGKLIALLPLVKEPVFGIDLDAESRSAQMMVDHVDELGKNQPQGGTILRVIDIAIKGVEKPERGIGSVIESLILAFGKQVRDEAVADVMRKRAENPARFDVA